MEIKKFDSWIDNETFVKNILKAQQAETSQKLMPD